MIYALILLLPLILLFSSSGRSHHPLMDELHKWRYAHRGLHNEEYPENSILAFRFALEHQFGIELDIHLLADGNLAVVHDSDLTRVTGRSAIIESLIKDDLKDYPLMGTSETIPLFEEVLDLFHGRAPLIVELKSFNNNVSELCEKTARMLDSYDGLFCIESFDPRCVRWFRKNRPKWVRGQLSQNFLKYPTNKNRLADFIFKNYMLNFLSKPDFIAHRFEDRKSLSISICRKLWKLTGVSWTIQSQNDLLTAESEGWIPIFENFIP